MINEKPKPLWITTAPIAGTDTVYVEMWLGHREMGHIIVDIEDFADFIERLRLGFELKINQQHHPADPMQSMHPM